MVTPPVARPPGVNVAEVGLGIVDDVGKVLVVGDELEVGSDEMVDTGKVWPSELDGSTSELVVSSNVVVSSDVVVSGTVVVSSIRGIVVWDAAALALADC